VNTTLWTRRAATQYLRLLTFSAPIDKQIRTWNSWKPIRHKKADAALVAKALVVQDARGRVSLGAAAVVPASVTPPELLPELFARSARQGAKSVQSSPGPVM
jgi:hypothetical protein